jgi:tRNA G18 (ribose-2'-O)-methylase SpoU
MPRWTSPSPDDPRLAALRGLPRGAGARTEQVIVEGVLAVVRALAAGHRAELVVASASAAARLDPAQLGDAETLLLAESDISTLVGFTFHRGCIAVLSRPRGEPSWLRRRPVRVLALDRVSDPANVGAIVRTARALAIDLVLLGRGCGDPWSRRAVRASMGAVLEQPLLDQLELADAIAELRAHDPELGWWVADANPPAIDLGALAIPPRLAIVLGNEGEGVTAAVREHCDATVRIPIAVGVDSLNVAAAAAILLWQTRAQDRR